MSKSYSGGKDKKADVLMQSNVEMSAKLDAVTAELQKISARIEALKKEQDGNYAEMTKKSEALSHEECASIKREMLFLATQSENIFTALTKQISELAEAINSRPAQVQQPAAVSAPAEIDYDKLAAKVAEMLPAQEFISPDYIASKVAEQIIIPENDVVATDSQQSTQTATESASYSTVAAVPANLQYDEEELADRIALKVGTIKAEDFDILVDDDGCASIANAIVEKLDYDIIATEIADRLGATLEYFVGNDAEYEEIASPDGETDNEEIASTGESDDGEQAVSEDSEEQAAEAETEEIGEEVIPESESDEIADKVVSQLLQTQESYVSRFDSIDKDLDDIKKMIVGGAIIRETASSEDAVVTVSEVMDDEEEVDGEFDALEVNEDAVDVDLDALNISAGGVDFENMMKYNRSFIARIIQSTDEQKEYYGRVKTALLSYAKVNSNIAWGAERFNKGRETIARFKIRGKTLVLYLALNPTDYPYSVYHHTDVSGNKSLKGTPMMIKIKSDRGAKKAIRLIDEMLENRGAVKRAKSIDRDYAAMYPFETMEELIEDGLVKDVGKK